MGVKMVLSGEGPMKFSVDTFIFIRRQMPGNFTKTIHKLSKLHLYDCLRANKSLAAWGVEGRVPFLDKEFWMSPCA
jgi:asparagine synthase (glutamine-hydrolysing)